MLVSLSVCNNSGVGGSLSNRDNSTKQANDSASLATALYASVTKTTAGGSSNDPNSSVATTTYSVAKHDENAGAALAGNYSDVAKDTPTAAARGMVVMDDSGKDEAGYSTIRMTQYCHHCCREVSAQEQELVNYQGNLWHPHCFV